MHKLNLSTIQRISALITLRGHDIIDYTKFNRALKIDERLSLTKEEEEKINFKRHDNGTLSWGMDEEGNLITDIDFEVELSDEMAELLKEVLESKVKKGITLASSSDKAIVEMLSQIQDPTRLS